LWALDNIAIGDIGYGFSAGYNYHDTTPWAVAGDPVYVQDDGSIGPAVGTVVRDCGQALILGTATSDMPGYVYLDARVA
jgi:hypothetical protein